MKPFSPFIILALAVALLAAPILSPTVSANDSIPIAGNSQYSVYRAWNDISVSGSAPGNDYSINYAGDINALISAGLVVIDGRIQLKSPPSPYQKSVFVDDLPVTNVKVNADYTVCWLNSNLQIEKEHYSPDGMQNHNYGSLATWLMGYEWMENEITHWLENITISIFIGETPVKVAEYKISAAFSEAIMLMAEYSTTANPSWRVSDIWNHPSTTSPLWQGINAGSSWKSPLAADFGKIIDNDKTRMETIFAEYQANDHDTRTAYYGYLESLKSRLASVSTWQLRTYNDQLNSPLVGAINNGTADLTRGMQLNTKALAEINAAQTMILNGFSLKTIRADIRTALNDHHQAILYTDRAIVKDSITQWQGLYDSQEDFRTQYIDFYITPYLDNGLFNWVMSSTGIVLIGMVAALGIVAVVYKSGFAALATVAALIVSWFSYRGGFM